MDLHCKLRSRLYLVLLTWNVFFSEECIAKLVHGVEWSTCCYILVSIVSSALECKLFVTACKSEKRAARLYCTDAAINFSF